MTKIQRPFGRNSNVVNVLENPSGPHQRASRAGSANARNTRSGGAHRCGASAGTPDSRSTRSWGRPQFQQIRAQPARKVRRERPATVAGLHLVPFELVVCRNAGSSAMSIDHDARGCASSSQVTGCGPPARRGCRRGRVRPWFRAATSSTARCRADGVRTHPALERELVEQRGGEHALRGAARKNVDERVGPAASPRRQVP